MGYGGSRILLIAPLFSATIRTWVLWSSWLPCSRSMMLGGSTSTFGQHWQGQQAEEKGWCAMLLAKLRRHEALLWRSPTDKHSLDAHLGNASPITSAISFFCNHMYLLGVPILTCWKLGPWVHQQGGRPYTSGIAPCWHCLLRTRGSYRTRCLGQYFLSGS